jgi:hypothetical protein
MDKNDLKILSGAMIWESSLPKNAKIQLIRFIKEANETQLKALVLDGTIIPSSKLDEITREVIDERFDNKIETFKVTLGKIKNSIQK